MGVEITGYWCPETSTLTFKACILEICHTYIAKIRKGIIDPMRITTDDIENLECQKSLCEFPPGILLDEMYKYKLVSAQPSSIINFIEMFKEYGQQIIHVS